MPQQKHICAYCVMCVYIEKMQTEIDRDDRFMQISDMCCARAKYVGTRICIGRYLPSIFCIVCL